MIHNENNNETRLSRRHRLGKFWLNVFRLSTLVGIIALSALLYNIADGAFGYVVIENEIDPKSLSVDGIPLDDLDKETLIEILQNNISAGLFR